jgi:hypothetical protein
MPHRPKLLEWLKDPRNAVAYVEAVLDEGDSKVLILGGISCLAEPTASNSAGFTVNYDGEGRNQSGLAGSKSPVISRSSN